MVINNAMNADWRRQEMHKRTTLEELHERRKDVLRLFGNEEAWRISTFFPLLISWGVIFRAFDQIIGDWGDVLWFFAGLPCTMFFVTLRSRKWWRLWVIGWSMFAVVLLWNHHDWRKLTIAGWGCAIAFAMTARSQEIKVQALTLASKFDLLDAASSIAGGKGDIRSSEVVEELYLERKKLAAEKISRL
jgi:hypothetical protein